MSLDMGTLRRADGSGRFAYGAQATVASIYGPAEVRIRDELTDVAAFQLVVSPLEGGAGIPTKALAAELQKMFKAVLLLHHHPRTIIQLTVQTLSVPQVSNSTLVMTINGRGQVPLQEPNSTQQRGAPPLLALPDRPLLVAEIAASINGSTLAILDAALPMRATVTAASCVVLHYDDAKRTRDVTGTQGPFCILVDPSPEEESIARSCHVFAFAFSGQNAMQATPDEAPSAQLVFQQSWGNTSGEQRRRLYEAAEEASLSALSYW
ncbi:Rrp46p [Malassezia vespertilionis]|uniref:Rrp46p n=1 Tax=Malassezia vespertilionis TaxID=2020962 RepID=A0A2N1JFA9_9BASI|nr:Rrp46p [Malassezia vespertilionis]